MAKDFRASQIQTTQIIASGSSGTNARIVVYPVEKQSGVVPNQGIIDSNKFGTGSIGTDIFIYVSGGINERNTNNNSITVFGGDVHISGNLTSDQQIPGEESLFRLQVVDFAVTEQTSSNPKVVGQVIFPATEFTGSSLTLRAILSNTEGSGVAAIKLFNLTDLAFVEIAGPSQEELSVTGSTPTLVESVNLISASGFNTSSVGLYELQLFSSTGSNTAQVGGGELRPSGSFSGLTIISSSLQASDITFDSSTTGLSSSNVQDAIEELSGSIAADINSLFFPKNVLDNSGDRTLSDQDSGRIIFMNGTTTNYVRIPPTLSDGFSAILVQSSSIQVVVLSTSSLKYPSTTFKTGSAEQNSILFVYSGSSGIFLGGDMELI